MVVVFWMIIVCYRLQLFWFSLSIHFVLKISYLVYYILLNVILHTEIQKLEEDSESHCHVWHCQNFQDISVSHTNLIYKNQAYKHFFAWSIDREVEGYMVLWLHCRGEIDAIILYLVRGKYLILFQGKCIALK